MPKSHYGWEDCAIFTKVVTLHRKTLWFSRDVSKRSGGTYTKPNSSVTQLAVARKVYLRLIRWAPAVSEVNGGWTTVRRQLLACVVLLSKNMKTERLIRALLQNQGNTFFCNHLPLNKTVSDLLIKFSHQSAERNEIYHTFSIFSTNKPK